MSDLAEYLAARTLEAGLGTLPDAAGRALGRVLGGLARYPAGLRRGVVEGQIAAAFPGREREWVESVARQTYRHFGEEIVRISRLARVSPTRLLERTTGAEEARRTWEAALAADRGALVVTGHLGNWELAGALLAALGLRVAAVVKEQRNLRFDRRLRELRARLGIRSIYMREAGRRIPEALAGGGVVALVADQDAGGRGIFVPFLGRPASVFRGPARIALRAEVPLLFGALVREEAGPGYRAILRPVPRPEGRGAERELTRRWVAALEDEVRARPGQYFWFHRRWKTRPPGEAE